MEVVFAQRARRDIAEIYDDLASKNPAAALRVETLIREKCERLALFPQSAFQTNEPNVYRLPLVRFPYAIFYRLDVPQNRVEIARVIHSASIKDLQRMPTAKST